jgi:hypothetical protein
MAQLMALIANVNRDPKRRKTPWAADDFLPQRGPRPDVEVEALRPRFDAAMAAFGGQKRTAPTDERPTTSTTTSAARTHSQSDRKRTVIIGMPPSRTDPR